jgi:hypothetical protein
MTLGWGYATVVQQGLPKLVCTSLTKSGRCTGVVPDGQNLQRVVVDRGGTLRTTKYAE